MGACKVLDIQFEFQGAADHIYPVLLLNESDAVLVDCGYPGFMGLIESAMKRHGVSAADLTKIVLTHQDDDHMGAASEFVGKYPHIQIAASAVEAPYISGAKKNLRLEQAERMQKDLPESQQEFGRQFCERLRKVQPVAVDLPLHGGDRFDWGGGCEIVSTPCHTPGHISLLLRDTRTVITGDAAVIEDNHLSVANPQFCLDLALAERSLEQIREMGCKRCICYHGGVLHPATE